MKFSYAWIREFVPDLDVDVIELEKLITVRTAECEGFERIGKMLDGARVARVLTAEKVAGTHITRATVDIGESDPITVACGAPNCRAGLQTVWVPIGRKVIQGVESNGMLASAQELDLGRDHTGIIEWRGTTIDIGPDVVIVIDNKSLTHRPDLWGHVGMAREVAAITGNALRDPADLALLPERAESPMVRVDDFHLCPRFSAVAFENVRVGPSPYWLQYRLTAAGLNPINNIVDITNYVMAEIAQPMHAFDRDKLRGDQLIVRAAFEGEPLAALNDEDYTLTPACGVVADAEGAISIAGVIGGRGSAISESTTNVVFESANWNAGRIRRVSSALKLRTDASMRFEKAQDPANTVRALARAVALMKEICPDARVAGGLTDVHETLPRPETIRLRLDMVDRKLGRVVSPQRVRDILERLAFHVENSGGGAFAVTVPSWRATKDVSAADDLVEEVGRMIGYDTIEPAPPMVACTVPPDNPERGWHRELRALLTARGYTEVYNYSFLSDAQAERFQLSPGDQVRVLNPIASDQNILRSSLIPGIFANLELNAKHFPSFRLFEIGREIHNQAPALPKEVTHLAAALYASEGDGSTGLFELKRVAESVAPGVRIRPTGEVFSFEHPARTANVLAGDIVVGRLFELSPTLIAGRAAILDLNLDRIFGRDTEVRKYAPVQRFPSSAFDLSVVTPNRHPAGDMEDALRNFADPLLKNVEYLREYHGPRVPEGMKSISYRFTVGAADRTLSSDEVNAVRAGIINLISKLGFETRV